LVVKSSLGQSYGLYEDDAMASATHDLQSIAYVSEEDIARAY
jgi:hypothetical protein